MSGWPRGRSRDGGIDRIPLPDVAGRLWLCGKHLVGPDPEAALTRVGAGTIVCLNERHELADRYPDYVAWLEREAPPAAGPTAARAWWFPTPDLGVRPIEPFLELVSASVSALADGRHLVAHCGAGIGRAGTFAAAVLLALGSDVDRALATVAEHRPLAGPEAGSQRALIDEVADRLAV